MLKKYTINELVDQVNEKIKSDKSLILSCSDNRMSELVTERKVRDLLSKNLISRGQKSGRTVYFDDLHIDQVIEVKKLQTLGITSKLLISYGRTNNEETNIISHVNESELKTDNSKNSKLQNDVLNELNMIGKNSGIFGDLGNKNIKEIFTGSSASTNSSVVNKSSDRSFIEETEKYRSLNKLSVKSYLEYPLDNTGGLILKMESGYKVKDKEELINKINQIIGDL